MKRRRVAIATVRLFWLKTVRRRDIFRLVTAGAALPDRGYLGKGPDSDFFFCVNESVTSEFPLCIVTRRHESLELEGDL